MTQFDSLNIIVNGYDLFSRLGLKSYTIKNTSDKLYGVTRSMETQDSLNDEVYLTNFKNTRPTLDVELAKVDNWGNTATFTDNDLDELARILFAQKVCKLEAGSLIYYGSFIDGTNWRNPNNEGFVCLKYELVSPYAYTVIYTDKKVITSNKIIEIMNKSNVYDYSYLDVEIKQLGTSPIKIENITTGESIKINNIMLNEEVTVLSEYKEIFSSTNLDKNMFKNIEYNKHFLRMRYGKNRIKVTGNCICLFRYQSKMFLK